MFIGQLNGAIQNTNHVSSQYKPSIVKSALGLVNGCIVLYQFYSLLNCAILSMAHFNLNDSLDSTYPVPPMWLDVGLWDIRYAASSLVGRQNHENEIEHISL